jgi:hypothetical protein
MPTMTMVCPAGQGGCADARTGSQLLRRCASMKCGNPRLIMSSVVIAVCATGTPLLPVAVGQLDAAPGERRDERVLLDRRAVEMRELEIVRREQRVAVRLVMVGKTDVAREHRHFDAREIRRRKACLRIVGQVHELERKPRALRRLVEQLAVGSDKSSGQQYPGHRWFSVRPV